MRVHASTPGRFFVFLASCLLMSSPLPAADRVAVSGGLIEGTTGVDPTIRLPMFAPDQPMS